ncbi:hypothetical protein C8R47DRAFT_1327197 [Mycena vitilis]|nr:hypothetical protein C8R47DRAFT_1327197 [Mycena vitilis]
MAEQINSLKTAYSCSDKQCSSPVCYLGNPAGEHVRMTPQHLNTWASAILASLPEVDLDTPPPNKMFQPKGQDDVDDIGLLAARRRNQAKPQSSPTITINNDFAGLALILRPLPATPGTPAPRTHVPGTMPQNPSPVKPAQMSFDAFCTAADLGDIPAKVAALRIRGPHILEFIENSVLDNYLVIGEPYKTANPATFPTTSNSQTWATSQNHSGLWNL